MSRSAPIYVAHNPEAGLMAEVVRRGADFVVRLIDTDTDDLLSARRYHDEDKATDGAERAVCMQ